MSKTKLVGQSRMSEREFIGFLSAITALSAVGIDSILPAFGEIRDDFGIADGTNATAFIVTVYILGMGGGQIFTGPLGDRFGRLPVVRVGLLLYLVGAIGAAFAPSIGFMYLSRFVWGLGAAVPRALSVAMTRDTYKGDAMARIMSLVMTFFLLAPAIGPLIGEGILSFASWRWVFAFSALTVVLAMIWSFRCDETLPVDQRRPLTFSRTAQAAKAVVQSRWAMGFGLALMFELGAFFVFLSSSEAVFEDAFGRGSQFAYFFGVGAVFMGLSTLTASRSMDRFGAVRVMTAIAVGYLAFAVVFFTYTKLGDGVPSFWPWIIILMGMNCLHAVILPTAQSLAMLPMGDLAGTAAGIIGTISMMGGALLGGIIDQFVDGTATPMAFGYLFYGVFVVAAVFWAKGGSPDSVT